MRITTVVPLATAALTALTVLVAAPANAELYGVDDPQDTAHGSDVRALSVRNGKENVTITTVHENLRRDPASGSGEAIYLDTDRSNRGPEFVFVAGLFEGTDYVLSETDGFGPKNWGDPVENGDYILRIDYAKDRARVRISQPALGNADAVRVAVRASGTRTDGSRHDLVDWVGKPRHFTPWLQRG